MKKRRKIVASDIDGTIIDRSNNISPKILDAIKKIQNKKIPFAICTGKSYSVSKGICEQFDANYGIFGNGTQIVDLKTGKELHRNILTQEDLLFVATMAKRFHYHIHIYTDNAIITEKLKYMDLRNFKLKKKNGVKSLKFKIVLNIVDYIEKHKPEVFSAVITTEDTTLQEFKNLLNINDRMECTYINKRGEYRDQVINKDYEYLNITPTNIDKDQALEFLSKYLKVPRSQVLAIGDNVNDLNMVKNSGIGVAVNDAYDDLKEVATYVTETKVSDGAFAEAINKYI